MSPRQASKTDEQILDRAIKVVRTHGPKVTLSQIAREVGLSAPRLVQRFGSRDRLLALVEARVDFKMRAAIVKAMSQSSSPIEGLIDSLAGVTERNARRLYQLAHSYIYDPGDVTLAQARETAERDRLLLEEFRTVLDRAVAAGELAPSDTKQLARVVFVTWIGSYTVWAYAPVGSLTTLLRSDLRRALAPYRARTARPRRRGLRIVS
ncbi:MAG: TetR/AcrR family transcriptional regulator [Gemmatimonadaceae bacterium]